MTMERLWITLGLLGQLLFAGRFLIQWLSSESAGRSVIPAAFWYFSMGGSLMLLAYAIHRGDPVFVLGQSTGLFIYLRNLHLLRREHRQSVTAAGGAP